MRVSRDIARRGSSQARCVPYGSRALQSQQGAGPGKAGGGAAAGAIPLAAACSSQQAPPQCAGLCGVCPGGACPGWGHPPELGVGHQCLPWYKPGSAWAGTRCSIAGPLGWSCQHSDPRHGDSAPCVIPHPAAPGCCASDSILWCCSRSPPSAGALCPASMASTAAHAP